MSSAKWRLFGLGLNELTLGRYQYHHNSFTGYQRPIASIYHLYSDFGKEIADCFGLPVASYT